MSFIHFEKGSVKTLQYKSAWLLRDIVHTLIIISEGELKSGEEECFLED